jgi:hypothetical protein
MVISWIFICMGVKQKHGSKCEYNTVLNVGSYKRMKNNMIEREKKNSCFAGQGAP